MNDDNCEIENLRSDYEAAPENLDIAVHLAQLYTDKGWLNEAIEIYSKLITTFPNDFSLHLAFGNVCFTKQKYKESIRLFKKLTIIKPNRVEGWNNLGITQLSIEDYKGAKASFNKVLELEPDNHGALLNMGNYYDHFGHFNRAIDMFKKATAIRPDFTDGWFNLGNAYLKTQQYQFAIDVYKKSLKYKPMFFSAYKNIGFAYEQIHDYAKAEQYYSKALDLNKGDAALYMNFGSVNRKLGRYDKAKDFFWRAVKLSPKESGGWLGLRELSLKKGDIATYVKSTLAIINQLSGDEIAETIQILRKLNQSDSVEQVLELAEKFEKKSDGINAERMVYFQKNKKDSIKAQLMYRKLSTIQNPTPHVLHCMANYSLASSQFDKAIQYVKQIKKRDISEDILLWSALVEKNDYDTVEPLILEYVSKHVDCFEGWFLLAKIKANTHTYDQAEKYLIRALENGFTDLERLYSEKELKRLYKALKNESL